MELNRSEERRERERESEHAGVAQEAEKMDSFDRCRGKLKDKGLA